MRTRSGIRALAVATAAAAVVLAGCSSGPQSAAQSSSGGRSLKLTTIADDKGTAAVVTAFQAANPGVKISVESAPTDSVQTNIRTQLSSGTAPDVFVVWPGDGSPTAVRVVAGANYLADLSAEPWVSTVPASLKPLLGVGDKTYMASATVASISGIYNTQAMAAVGVTPPTTWSQLLTMCDKAKAKGKAAFALGNQTPWVTQLIDYSLAATLVYGRTPDFASQMSQGKVTFAGSAWATTMDKYVEMDKRGCFNANPLGTSYESSLSMVAKGQTLGIVQVNSALSPLKTAAPAGTTFETAALPATDDASQTVMPLAGGAGLAINAKTPNMELAKQFLTFVMSPAGLALNAKASTGLPSVPVSTYSPDAALAGVLAAQKGGKVTPFMDQSWPNARVQQTHFTEVQKVFSKSATVEQALTEMDKAYKQG